MPYVRAWHVALIVVAATALALVGGASKSAAEPLSQCRTDGRLFCVDIEDLDGRSHTVTSPHYMRYIVKIRNTGGSKLTNGRATLTLTDIIGEDDAITDDPEGDPDDVASSAVFRPSPISASACKIGSASNVLTCTVPGLPAGAKGSVTYDPLIFVTSTNADATATKLTADVSFKEKGSDNQPSDPNVDSLSAFNPTTYEDNEDEDVSWAFPTAAITLATSTSDEQHSSFPLPTVPAGTPPFTASLIETDVEDVLPADNPCETTCFGQIVKTFAGGVTPFELLVTWNFVPSGFTENGGVVYHQPDPPGDLEVITESCDVALPCRDIEIDHLPGGNVIVTIHIRSAGNGSVGIG